MTNNNQDQELEPRQLNGTEGQDRESYTDDQDRNNYYTPDDDEALPENPGKSGSAVRKPRRDIDGDDVGQRTHAQIRELQEARYAAQSGFLRP